MKATNKHEFFELLEAELNRIGIEDTADIFADFEEHFSDSAMQGIPEDVAAERLGDIKEIARSYLNLESSRINSIMARDVERRKVSLTKPGRGVPADLSLMDGSVKDALNSDNIREYTPQHYSEEIYPDNSQRTSVNGIGGYAGSSANQSGSAGTAGSASYSNSTGGSVNTGGTDNSAAGNENKSVADAFSDAGRAAVDAAKITGHAVADAFRQSGVKDAVVGAGKSAVDAVKAAGHSAADAIRDAKAKHDANKQSGYDVPHPTDSYRENMNTAEVRHTDSFRANNSSSNKGEIPPQKTKGKPGYKFIDTKGLKTNFNSTKFVIAILLDLFVWSWALPLLFGGWIGLFGSGIVRLVAGGFNSLFSGGYYFITRLFQSGMFITGAVMAVCVAWWILKLLLNLVRFIVNMHIKAIYDL